LVIGNATGSNSLIVNGNLEATGQIKSQIATGTAPFTVASTTKVTNLNADLLDGFNTATASTGSTVAVRNSDGSINATTANFVGGGSVSITPVANAATSGNISWGLTMPSTPAVSTTAASSANTVKNTQVTAVSTTGCTAWIIRENTTVTTVYAVAVSG
jgi:hypothetical protein